MSFAVFLDIDGVLNTKTTCERTPELCRGIDDARVEVLAKAMSMYRDAIIVLSSDWKELSPSNEDYIYLVNKLNKYGLSISDKTEDHYYRRGEGIANYLESHPEIDEYVILDDNTFDFEDYGSLWERLLLTNGIERAECASSTPAIEAILFLDCIREDEKGQEK